MRTTTKVKCAPCGSFTAVLGVSMVTLALAAQSLAADITVTTAVDRTKIGVNEQLQLTVEISGSDAMRAGDPELPNMDNFAAFGGSSTSQNIQFINGVMQASKTYTYFFLVRQIGKFEIGPVKVKYKGETFQSAPIDIEIVKSGAPSGQQPRPGGSQGPTSSPPSEDMSENLFLKTEVSKRKVYQNEPILVEYKIYTRVQVTNYALTGQPNYGDFWSEEFPISGTPQTHEEVIGGQRYIVATIKKVALFPTSSGPKSIPPLEIEASVRMRERRARRDIFDSFFDDPFFGRNTTYKIASEPVKIEVLPLPVENRPPDFSGAVGSYTMTTNVDRKAARTNEAITFKLVLAGKGNIRILPAPRVKFPGEFEIYDPKVNDDLSRAGDEVSGKKSFEYVLIPRRAGHFVIDRIVYTYFDPRQREYRTLWAPAVALEISEGEKNYTTSGSGLSKKEVELLGQDIRYIAKSPDRFIAAESKFYKSASFWAVLLLPVLVVVAGVLHRSHQDRMTSNIAYARNRKAQSVAQHQLRTAKLALAKGEVANFYAESARALTAFVGNKLNLAESSLVTDELASQLENRGVDSDLVKKYKELLAECDFRRFAMPNASETALADSYDKVKNVLVDLEKAL